MNEKNQTEKFLVFLLKRFSVERRKFDRSGVYAYTQRIMAYNSNKMEGGLLTEEQTVSLFDSGILPRTDAYYRAKDIEEMNGHFLMFNRMLDTLEEPLTQELIKAFHYEFKSGVFEDRVNGYAIGDYKKHPNRIRMYATVKPDVVAVEMEKLLTWYYAQTVNLSVLAAFHARYESIHPFQDGNGRTGRLILFRECLKHNMISFVIEDANRYEYLEALKAYREKGDCQKLVTLFQKEQDFYYKQCRYFFEQGKE